MSYIILSYIGAAFCDPLIINLIFFIGSESRGIGSYIMSHYEGNMIHSKPFQYLLTVMFSGLIKLYIGIWIISYSGSLWADEYFSIHSYLLFFLPLTLYLTFKSYDRDNTAFYILPIAFLSIFLSDIPLFFYYIWPAILHFSGFSISHNITFFVVFFFLLFLFNQWYKRSNQREFEYSSDNQLKFKYRVQ